jgi:hypothetical protein
VDDEIDHRSLGIASYQRCWELLDRDNRSKNDEVELLTEAFTARHHWLLAGGTQEWIISDWMVARAAAAVGDGPLSVRFAVRADAATKDTDVDDWLRASTAEGVARAYAALGDATNRDLWAETSARLVEAIADDEDRALIADQLASVPAAKSP